MAPLRSVVLVEEHPSRAAGGIALRNAANVAGLAALGPVTVVGAGDPAGPLPLSTLGERRCRRTRCPAAP